MPGSAGGGLEVVRAGDAPLDPAKAGVRAILKPDQALVDGSDEPAALVLYQGLTDHEPASTGSQSGQCCLGCRHRAASHGAASRGLRQP